MWGYIISHHPDKTVLTVMKNENIVRKVELINEKEYVVQPDNTRKLKNRGRRVILKSVESNAGEVTAKVKYLDTNRPGRVDIADLDNIQLLN
jgi:Ni,Fe-hydrogenase III large subunit